LLRYEPRPNPPWLGDASSAVDQGHLLPAHPLRLERLTALPLANLAELVSEPPVARECRGSVMC